MLLQVNKIHLYGYIFIGASAKQSSQIIKIKKYITSLFSPITAAFKSADLNNDGFVTPAEFENVTLLNI